jgi:ribosomal-protein-alanine N-acetyltransferase
VKLRDMVRDDMPAVMALEEELFPEDAWTPEMFSREFAESPSRRRYLVAEDTTPDGPELIGYAGMLFTGGPEADVLTQALIDEATGRRCTEVFLEVREDNPRARELYRRHGFTEIGVRRGYYQPGGIDAIVMRKDLD